MISKHYGLIELGAMKFQNIYIYCQHIFQSSFFSILFFLIVEIVEKIVIISQTTTCITTVVCNIQCYTFFKICHTYKNDLKFKNMPNDQIC